MNLDDLLYGKSPTEMTDEELETVIRALGGIREHGAAWSADYTYNRRTNEFTHKDDTGKGLERVRSWFNLQS